MLGQGQMEMLGQGQGQVQWGGESRKPTTRSREPRDSRGFLGSRGGRGVVMGGAW